MSKIIGIDLGTTNSCVSIIEGGQPVVIANSEGKRTTPSIIGFTKDGERKVGDPARRQAVTNPKNTVYAIKRFMGMSYDDAKDEAERVAYTVTRSNNNTPSVEIEDRTYTPQELSAIILQKMKKTAEEYLGEEVKEAVITVPAYFNDAQRQATKEAGQIAGLDVKRIINEPTAAALAYGIDKQDKSFKICVFDCGGGTHDVSILEFGDGVFEVLSTNGNTHLGGEDFDQRVVDYLAEEFAKDNDNMDLRKDAMAMQRLKEAAEKAKIELSTNTTTEINLPYITALDGVPRHLVMTLTRSKFEQLCDDLFQKTIDPAKKALSDANISASEIDEILLVGGSTRIPKIQELVKETFGKEASKNINPDEAVAIGASIQGGVLAGDVKDVLLLDVLPITIGIETMNNTFTPLVEANTTIPIKKSQIFSTATDNQSAVTVRVLQGMRIMASDNKQIGIFNLDGIAPAPMGVPQIEISLDVDANGILTVTAVDKATNKEQHITIEGSSNLSDDEIERMKAEAVKYAEEDKKKKEELDKINSADSMTFQVEKSLKEMDDKLNEEEKKEITELVESLKKSVTDKNIEDIDKNQKALEDKWFPIMQRIYQQANPQSGNTATEGFDPKTFFNGGGSGNTTDGPEEAETV